MSPADRLVYMVNQIARNLAAQGRDAAVLATANHIDAYWSPRMKAQLIAIPDPTLDPAAAAAVERLRQGRPPPPQSAATRFEGGGSDAG